MKISTKRSDIDVSVVMSTWNNSARLGSTLSAFCECVVRLGIQWELVLVNNNCSDDTNHVAELFADKLPLVFVHEPISGLSHGRNAGIAAASGRLIVFTDDDVLPDPYWIGIFYEAYRSKPRGFFFGGPVISNFEAAPPDGAIMKLAPFSVVGLDLGSRARQLKRREYFIGANWACPAEALGSVGGFDTRRGLRSDAGVILVGEEVDLMQRLRQAGWRPWYLPEAKIRHFVPERKCSLEYILARYEAGVLQRARDSLDQRTSVLGRAYTLALLHTRAAKHWFIWNARPVVGYSRLQAFAAWRGIRTALKTGICSTEND
jgi:glycosyltransferase involved in cell wall biosynthesis